MRCLCGPPCVLMFTHAIHGNKENKGEIGGFLIDACPQKGDLVWGEKVTWLAQKRSRKQVQQTWEYVWIRSQPFQHLKSNMSIYFWHGDWNVWLVSLTTVLPTVFGTQANPCSVTRCNCHISNLANWAQLRAKDLGSQLERFPPNWGDRHHFVRIPGPKSEGPGSILPGWFIPLKYWIFNTKR